MAYNHGREDRKWQLWKEAEDQSEQEQLLGQIETLENAYRADESGTGYHGTAKGRKRLIMGRANE